MNTLRPGLARPDRSAVPGFYDAQGAFGKEGNSSCHKTVIKVQEKFQKGYASAKQMMYSVYTFGMQERSL